MPLTFRMKSVLGSSRGAIGDLSKRRPISSGILTQYRECHRDLESGRSKQQDRRAAIWSYYFSSLGSNLPAGLSQSTSIGHFMRVVVVLEESYPRELAGYNSTDYIKSKRHPTNDTRHYHRSSHADTRPRLPQQRKPMGKYAWASLVQS